MNIVSALYIIKTICLLWVEYSRCWERNLTITYPHILTAGSIQSFRQPRSCLQHLYRHVHTMLHPSIACADALSNVCHVFSHLLLVVIVNVDYISITRCWWASPTSNYAGYDYTKRCSDPHERVGHPTNITFPRKRYLACRVYHHQIQPHNIGDVFPTVS